MKDFLMFRGASSHTRDDGTREYTERGEICIRESEIIGFYDHTILTASQVIKVMDTFEELQERIMSK